MRVSLGFFVLIPYPTGPIALLGFYADLPALIINQDYRRYLPDLIQLLFFLEMVLPAIVSIDLYILLVLLLWWGAASTPLCPPILFFLQLDSGHRGGWLPQTRKLSHHVPSLLPLEHLLGEILLLLAGRPLRVLVKYHVLEDLLRLLLCQLRVETQLSDLVQVVLQEEKSLQGELSWLLQQPLRLQVIQDEGRPRVNHFVDLPQLRVGRLVILILDYRVESLSDPLRVQGTRTLL